MPSQRSLSGHSTRIKKTICRNFHSNSGKEPTAGNPSLIAYLALLWSTCLPLLLYFQRSCHICLEDR
ncbi:hypothetical protein ACFX1W_000272 [Malus domestica]